MIQLNQKFNGNFTDWTSVSDLKLERSFTGLHCIATIGEILSGRSSSTHHKICCKIYDEIFSDGASSIYLAANAMDKPANIVLRRILELGLAAIYLWDMPHAAYSWNLHNHDLSFTEMVNHINSKGYISYINSENESNIIELISSSRTQSIYGKLSDIVHGKITTFESSLPDRFTFVEKEWHQFIQLFDEVVFILIKAAISRFNIEHEICSIYPPAIKEIK